MEPHLGLDAAVSTSGSPSSRKTAANSWVGIKMPPWSTPAGLDVQNANKTPNHSVCHNSQTKHGRSRPTQGRGCSFPSEHSQTQLSSMLAFPKEIRVVLPRGAQGNSSKQQQTSKNRRNLLHPQICSSGGAAEVPTGRKQGGNRGFLKNSSFSSSKGARRRGELKPLP